MPKISIVDRGAKDYQAWLSPESPDHLTPRALSSELVLTHEWQPGHHTLAERLQRWHAQFTSVAGGWTAPQAFCANNPAPGWVRYVQCLSLYVSTAVLSWVALHQGAMGAGNMTIVESTGGVATFLWLKRPLIWTSSQALSYIFNATAAGNVCEAEIQYADFRCCEPLPRY